MRAALLLALSLAPAPAAAQMTAECIMHTMCWDNVCESADDLAMALQPMGEGWELAWRQGAMFLYQGQPDDPDGVLALYEPYQDGRISIFTLYPSGLAVLTSHALDDGTARVSSFYGYCAGDGG